MYDCCSTLQFRKSRWKIRLDGSEPRFAKLISTFNLGNSRTAKLSGPGSGCSTYLFFDLLESSKDESRECTGPRLALIVGRTAREHYLASLERWRNNTVLESEIEQAARWLAEAHDCQLVKIRWPGRRGCLDRELRIPMRVSRDGFFHVVFIEFKQEKGIVSEQQADEIDWLAKAGASVYVIRSVEEFTQMFRRYVT